MNWDAALADYDRDLRVRGSAERTRRAYASDLAGFAEWIAPQGLAPADVRHRDVRRFGAALAGAGAAPATVARKLAAIRGLYGYLVRVERVGQNPAELVTSPKRSEKLPQVLTTEQMRSLLERIPAHTPLELRDRAMLELAYSCGLRCEEIVNLDLGAFDFEGERLRVLGKGSKERILPVGEPAQRALERYLERGRRALATDPREPALFLSKSGRRLSNSDVTRRLGADTIDIVVEGGITLARHRLLADGLGATVRDAGHVIALDTAAMSAAAVASGAGRPHRRKERIPPGPDALTAAAVLTGRAIPHNDIPATDTTDTTATAVGTVIDLAAYERVAHGRNTLT